MTALRLDRLERRYRRWLLACPAEYRRERGDELVATLLDLADPNRTRPAVLEVFAVLRLAAAQRTQCMAARWRSRWSPERRSRTVLRLGFAWASIMTISVFVAPLTLGYSCVDSQWGGMLIDCEPRAGFLLAHHGRWGYLWLLPPWTMALLAVRARRRGAPVSAALAMTVFVIATANTLGTYYLPSLLLIWLGAVWAKDPGMPDVVGATGIPGTSAD